MLSTRPRVQRAVDDPGALKVSVGFCFRPVARTRVHRTRGFTLLEMLLSIAIIALLGAVLIGGATELLNGERPVSVDQVFWKAVEEARKTALKNGEDVRMRFDREQKQFQIVDATASAVIGPDGVTRIETPLKTWPIESSTQDLEVDFLVASRGANAILVRGVLLESQPVPFVTFYDDGTCTPFRVQVFQGGAAHILAIDPWTCAPVLQAKATP